MLAGSCLCGEVRYEVDADASAIVHCHCATCRKAHGSAFSSVANVPREAFRWTSGEALLNSFESSPGKFRRFCSRCGSHVVADRPERPTLLLRLGCLDTPTAAVPTCHIWRSDGAAWYDPTLVLPELPRGV